MDLKIEIVPFEKKHQSDIDAIMQNIALEFEEPIYTKESKKIVDVYKLSNNKFWVALNGNNVIGTLGIVRLKNKNIILKSMFLEKKYRGKGISQLLLDHVINWESQNDCMQIYLGTMLQFKAAQQFYEKNGFTKCTPEELPADFIINPLDTIFYTKKL